MSGTPSPLPIFTGFLDSGAVNALGLVFTYLTGTSTKVDTFSDAALTSANANPIVLDSAGRATIFLTPGVEYRFVMSPPGDTDPPTHAIWDVDGITTTPSGSNNVDITGTTKGVPAHSPVAIYRLTSSDGKWRFAGSGTADSSTTAPTLGFIYGPITVNVDTTNTFRIAGSVTGLSGLVAGSLYYINIFGQPGLNPSEPGNNKAILQADSTTSGIVTAFYGSADLTSNAAFKVPNGQATFNAQALFYPGLSTDAQIPWSGVANVNVTPVNSINGTTDLMSYTVPKGFFLTGPPPSKIIRVTAHAYGANNNNVKTFDFWWNGVKVLTMDNNTDAQAWYYYCVNILQTNNPGDPGAQRISGYAYSGNNIPAHPRIIASFNTTGSADNATTPTVLKFTSTCTADSDLTQTFMLVEVVGFP